MTGDHQEHEERKSDTEDEVVTSHSGASEEGAARMHRSWRVLAATGFLGGLEISLGLLAYLLTFEATDSHLLGGLAFSIGFIALYLAHSELFTEGFYYPIIAIADGRGTALELARLWGVSLVMNLIGGWITMGLVAVGFPQLHSTLADAAHHFLSVGMSWQGAALAVLAGMAITLMTRMQADTESVTGKLVAAVCGGFLLVAGQLFHSVMDSLLMFGAIISGAPDVSYLDWLGWVWWVIPLNILGGLLLTTVPRILRSHEVRDGS